MKKYKIMTVVGARPQFIKAAPLSKALAESSDMTECLVHTGQHYDYALSQQFFDELGLPTPHHNLETGSGSHIEQMSHIMVKLSAVLTLEQPDLVVVFGDTNSTAAAAITTAKHHIPLAHVEAGLREFNKNTPEEINKMLTDAVTDLYFPPTQTGVDNLRKMGITNEVYLTGDIGIDLIINNLDKILAQKTILDNWGLQAHNYYFMTCHRAANTDNPILLEQIVRLLELSDKPIIFPIHPRTKAALERHQLWTRVEKSAARVIAPIGFWATQALIKHAKAVLTDSGGVIKEAYFHKVPCFILQHEIEWIEAVQEGWSHLVGTDTDLIINQLKDLKRPDQWSGFLGQGTAAPTIVAAIRSFLNRR